MVCTQNQVLNILLKSLLDKELIPQKTFESATNIINSTLDFPEFFWYPVCCQQAPAGAVHASNRPQGGSWRVVEEGENNGCS